MNNTKMICSQIRHHKKMVIKKNIQETEQTEEGLVFQRKVCD